MVAPAIICESTFRGWWQAAAWPDSYSAKGGSSCEQISVAQGQRVWKWQAGGGLTGLGTSPSSTTGWRSAFAFGSGIGTAESNATE